MQQRWIWPFELLEQIGKGGMGEVYKARYVKNDKLFAVKLVSLDVDNPTTLARFEREMEILKNLKHPNIVRCFGGQCDNKQRFYAMELVEGGTLRRLLKSKGPLRWEKAVDYAVQICAGLGHAHDQGIVHRDVKPGNFLIGENGQPKLADFGLATLATAEKLTSEGRTQGTFQYMAPEQIRGKPAPVPQTDLYAVGCVLFEMLTGHVPFDGKTPAECLHMHLKNAPPHVSDYVPGCPHELDRLIQDLLSKEIGQRPSQAGEVIRRLREINPLITVVDTKAASSQERTHEVTVKPTADTLDSKAIPPPETRYAIWPFYVSIVLLFVAGMWSWNTSEVRSVMTRSEDSWIKGLQDPNDTIRIFSARSAGKINMESDRILSALSAGMSDQNADVRAACAIALAEHGASARTTIPVLIKMQQTDPNPVVRAEAEKAIEIIRNAESSSTYSFWGLTVVALAIAGFAGYRGIRKLTRDA